MNEQEQIFGAYVTSDGSIRKISVKFDKWIMWKLAESEKEFMEPFRSIKKNENGDLTYLYSFASEGITDRQDYETFYFNTMLEIISGCVWLE